MIVPSFGAQGPCGLTVRKADDVDGHERFTQRLADVLKRRVDGGAVEGLADRIAPRRNLVESLAGRVGARGDRRELIHVFRSARRR